MKNKSRLLNGKNQAPRKNAVDKIADQMATIIAGFPGGLLSLLGEFYDGLNRQRKEAKKHHKPVPVIITDLTGVLANWQIVLFIVNELPEDQKQREQIEKEKLTEFLVKNPEARQLLAQILQVMRPALLVHTEVPQYTDPNMKSYVHRNFSYIKAIKEFFRRDPRKL
jgi:hypothetical protein